MSAERAAWESAPHGPSPQSGGLSSSWRERPCKDRPPGPLVGVDPGSLGVPSHPSSKGPVPCGWLVAQAGRAPWPEAPEPRGAPCPHTDMVGLGLLVAARPRLPAWHHVTRCAAPRGQTRPVLACQSLLGRDTNVPGRHHEQRDCLPSWLTVWGPRRPLSSAVPPGTPSALAGLRRSPPVSCPSSPPGSHPQCSLEPPHPGGPSPVLLDSGIGFPLLSPPPQGWH